MHSSDHVSMFSEDIPNNSQFGFSSALTAIVAGGLIYTFNGFQTVVAYASEVKNPGRNIPLTSVRILIDCDPSLPYNFSRSDNPSSHTCHKMSESICWRSMSCMPKH
ncbi:amino acid permease family protein [Francisella tularensis subsp. novicida]|nr:amino acid permease family protein [Francisella tularensis subsp. novicida]